VLKGDAERGEITALWRRGDEVTGFVPVELTFPFMSYIDIRGDVIGECSATVPTLTSPTETRGDSAFSPNIDKDRDDRDSSDIAAGRFSPNIAAFASTIAFSVSEAGGGFLMTEMGFDIRAPLGVDFSDSLVGELGRGFNPKAESPRHQKKSIK